MADPRERAKAPAFQWYPGDFRRDAGVAACTFEARSLWREMLDLMHAGEPYGHMTIGSAPIVVADLARMIGKPARTIQKWVDELESRRVFSRTDRGIIYSRRMVRDEQARRTRAKNGRLGGNPNLVNQPVGDGDNRETNDPVNQSPTENQPLPSSYLQSSSLPEEQALVIARALSIRANQGLREHPHRPQEVPRIYEGQGSTHEAVVAILAAGIPLPFAEAEVYRLAKTHNADDQIVSLKYFVQGVVRAWKRSEASAAALAAGAPPQSSNGADAGDAAIEEGVRRAFAKREPTHA